MKYITLLGLFAAAASAQVYGPQPRPILPPPPVTYGSGFGAGVAQFWGAYRQSQAQQALTEAPAGATKAELQRAATLQAYADAYQAEQRARVEELEIQVEALKLLLQDQGESVLP